MKLADEKLCLFRLRLFTHFGVPKDALSHLTDVFDGPLVAVIRQSRWIDVHCAVTLKEQRLFSRFHATRNGGTHDEEQIALSGSEERPIPVYQVDPALFADQ